MTPRSPHSNGGAIAFAERVLNLLDDGSFSATYKYAVLLALIDVCMERVSAKGVAPEVITTRQLAEKVLELYWPHTAPYPGLEEAAVLRQNSGGQAEILSAIRRYRDSLGEDPGAPLHRGKQADPKRFERLERHIEWKLIEMPLPRLQVLGTGEQRFVYDIAWGLDIRGTAVRQYQQGDSDAFDNRILLHPGVGEYLIRLNGVLRPLLHRHWASMVARFNRLEESKLERFLFGSERVPLVPVRKALRELQDNRCFYCVKEMKRQTHVDHFIPWSRYPDDGLDNLVIADAACNGYKKDFLASGRHVEKWRERMNEGALDEIVAATRWRRHNSGTLGVARAIYLRLPAAFQLWDRDREFVPAIYKALIKTLV